MKVLSLGSARGAGGIVDTVTEGPPLQIGDAYQCVFHGRDEACDFNYSFSTGPWGVNRVVSSRARRLIEREAPGARFAKIQTDQGVFWGILELPFQSLDEDASRATRLAFNPTELGALGLFNVCFEGEVRGPYATEAFAAA